MQAPLIVNCMLNSFLSYTTITLNTLTILALRRTSHLSKTLKMLLLNLAVTDLGVGLLAQPSYVVYLVMIIQGKTQTFTSEITFQIVYITGKLLSYVSFFGVVALAADKFLSIYLHLRYQELVTYKRVLAVVVSIWILSAILALIFSQRRQFDFFISVPIESVCYLATALCYLKIYLLVRHHKTQILTQRMQVTQEQIENEANAANLRKSATGTFYLYLVFVACYVPRMCIMTIISSAGESTALLIHLRLYTFTLVFLNSSLNPLIYCWKMRHVGKAIIAILRNLAPCRSNQLQSNLPEATS